MSKLAHAQFRVQKQPSVGLKNTLLSKMHEKRWARTPSVLRTTSQHEILNIPVRLKAHLAARKMLVRQTMGITVEKHTPQNKKNQVKNSLVRIVLSPGENGGRN